MDRLDHHAANIAAALTEFRDRVQQLNPGAVNTIANTTSLLESLAQDFKLNLEDDQGRKRSLPLETAEVEKLKHDLKDEKHKSEQLQHLSWLHDVPGPRLRVVLIATGSVASVKIPELAIKLCEFAEVAIVLTGPGEVMAGRVATRYAPDFAAKFGHLQADGQLHVLRDVDEWEGYQDVSVDMVVHVELRKWGDVAIIAPCSSNTLAKIALGLCDNLATCLVRAWGPVKPLLFAPAMNTVMWEHPTTAKHLQTIQSWGHQIVPPECKRLACGDVGRGALATVATLVEAVQHAGKGFNERRSQEGGPGAWQQLGFPEWQQT